MYRRDKGGHGNVARDGAAVILGHIDRNGIAANPFLDLEQPKLESVRVLMECSCGALP